MKFNEAMDALLDGNKVRQIYWRDNYYIMIGSHDHIIDSLGNIYTIDKTDLMLSWELYLSKVTVGALLSYAGNQYRVVLNNSDRLDIVNTNTWEVFIGNIDKDRIDFVIKTTSMKVINDSIDR